MKRLLLIGLITFFANAGFCQIQVRIEQIAKLETYLIWLKKGYGIVSDGLNIVDNIKHGDFSLHQGYFTSLTSVKTPIKGDAKIAAMIALQVQMLASYKSYVRDFRSSGVFTSQELIYLSKVFAAILDDAVKDINALTVFITDGSFQAKDDERISRINELYNSMADKYEFLYTFGDEVRLLGIQRKKELQETVHLQKLY